MAICAFHNVYGCRHFVKRHVTKIKNNNIYLKHLAKFLEGTLVRLASVPGHAYFFRFAVKIVNVHYIE